MLPTFCDCEPTIEIRCNTGNSGRCFGRVRGYARTHTDSDSRHTYSHGRTDIYSDTSAAYRNTDPYADTYAASDQHPNSHADVRAHTDYSADGRGHL